MKKTIVTLLISFTIAINAQLITDSTNNQKVDLKELGEHYLAKSKNQKTAAWILLSAGAVATTVGLITSLNQLNDFLDDDPSIPDDAAP